MSECAVFNHDFFTKLRRWNYFTGPFMELSSELVINSIKILISAYFSTQQFWIHLLQTLLIFFKSIQAAEWEERATRFLKFCKDVKQLMTRLLHTPHRSLLYDIYPYMWDMEIAVSMIGSFIKWLGMIAAAPPPANLLRKKKESFYPSIFVFYLLSLYKFAL